MSMVVISNFSQIHITWGCLAFNGYLVTECMQCTFDIFMPLWHNDVAGGIVFLGCLCIYLYILNIVDSILKGTSTRQIFTKSWPNLPRRCIWSSDGCFRFRGHDGIMCCKNHWLEFVVTTSWTRKLCYRKDDRAMRPVHGCPENVRDSLTTPSRPRLLFTTFFMGFCSDRPYECSYIIWSP